MPPTRAARWTTRLGRWSASIASAAPGTVRSYSALLGAITSAPRSDSLATTCRPRKPAPPVTRTRRPGQNVGMVTNARPTRPSWGGARPRARRLHPRAVLARRPGRQRGLRVADRRTPGPPSVGRSRRRRRPAPPATARAVAAVVPGGRPAAGAAVALRELAAVPVATGRTRDGSRRRLPRHRARAGTDTRAARRHRSRPGVRARPRGVHPARSERDDAAASSWSSATPTS